MRKVISLLLCLVMIISISPISHADNKNSIAAEFDALLGMSADELISVSEGEVVNDYSNGPCRILAFDDDSIIWKEYLFVEDRLVLFYSDVDFDSLVTIKKSFDKNFPGIIPDTPSEQDIVYFNSIRPFFSSTASSFEKGLMWTISDNSAIILSPGTLKGYYTIIYFDRKFYDKLPLRVAMGLSPEQIEPFLAIGESLQLNASEKEFKELFSEYLIIDSEHPEFFSFYSLYDYIEYYFLRYIKAVFYQDKLIAYSITLPNADSASVDFASYLDGKLNRLPYITANDIQKVNSIFRVNKATGKIFQSDNAYSGLSAGKWGSGNTTYIFAPSKAYDSYYTFVAYNEDAWNYISAIERLNDNSIIEALNSKDVKLQLPSCPVQIDVKGQNGTITESLRIDSAELSPSGVISFGDDDSEFSDISFIFSGEKIFDADDEGYTKNCSIGYKLLDSEGYVIASGNAPLGGLASGDKFRLASTMPITVYGGEKYELVLTNPF